MSSETDTGTPPTKAELLAQIDQSWQALSQTLGKYSDAELSATGPDGAWSVKDHLAHIAAWERSLLALLQGSQRSAAVGMDEASYYSPDTDTDKLNEHIYEHNRERPLPEVLAAFRDVHQQVLALLDGMSDADLLKPYSAYQPNEPDNTSDPVYQWINGNTHEHFDEHRELIEALVG